MKKFSFSLLIATISIVFLSACSRSAAPECSDGNVTSLVMDISTSELKNQLLSQAIITKIGTSPRVQGNPTYDQWNEIKSNNKDIKAIIDYVDKQIAETRMTLTGIRTDGKNDAIKKCECGGDLEFSNGKSFSIKYTAQYTEDGGIHVEVSGL